MPKNILTQENILWTEKLTLTHDLIKMSQQQSNMCSVMVWGCFMASGRQFLLQEWRQIIRFRRKLLFQIQPGSFCLMICTWKCDKCVKKNPLRNQEEGKYFSGYIITTEKLCKPFEVKFTKKSNRYQLFASVSSLKT